jgi:hypothetical protein
MSKLQRWADIIVTAAIERLVFVKKIIWITLVLAQPPLRNVQNFVATAPEQAPGRCSVLSQHQSATAAFVGIRRLRYPCEFGADLLD